MHLVTPSKPFAKTGIDEIYKTDRTLLDIIIISNKFTLASHQPSSNSKILFEA